MYLAPACTFWLLIGSMLLEWRAIAAEGAYLLMVSTGCAGGCAGGAQTGGLPAGVLVAGPARLHSPRTPDPPSWC